MAERPPAAPQPAPADRDSGDVRIALLPAAPRLVFRSDPKRLETLRRPVAAAFPGPVGATRRRDGLLVLRLGPDEWWVSGTAEAMAAFRRALRDAAPELPHALVDISDRDRDIAVVGGGAVDLLAGGCPLDLESMEVGRATRTLFGAAEAVVFREERDAFRLSVGRSFAPYVHGLLLKLAREARAIAGT